MKLPVGYVAGHGVTKATAYGGYGQRMLERMGWEKGQGLGKEKDGMKQAIEVKKKEDTTGVRAGARLAPHDGGEEVKKDAGPHGAPTAMHDVAPHTCAHGGTGPSSPPARSAPCHCRCRAGRAGLHGPMPSTGGTRAGGSTG